MTAAAKREAVTHLQAMLGVSERRACAIVGADRKSMRYRSARADDAKLRERLRALAQQRRRFGYRRLHVLLRRDGVTVNRKKTQRLYREEGLSVRRRKGRRKAGVGVDPLSWRLFKLSQEAITCREPVPHTHLSFGARWLSWSAPAVIQHR